MGNNIEHDLLYNLEGIVGDDDELIFYGVDILDEREFKKFIQRIEFLCRKSQEYDVWQKRTKMLAVHQNSDPNKCDSENCPICGIAYQYAPPESHHHPITLFNMVVAKFQEWVDNNILDDKQPLDLVFEVMFSHLTNRVEHVVLCKHCHERYHNGEYKTREALDIIIEYKREQEKLNYSDEKREQNDLKDIEKRQEREERQEFRRNALGVNLDDFPEVDLLAEVNKLAELSVTINEIGEKK